MYDSVTGLLLEARTPDPDGADNDFAGDLVARYRYDEDAIGDAQTAGPPLEGLAGAYFDNAHFQGLPEFGSTDGTIDFAGSPSWPGLVGDDLMDPWVHGDPIQHPLDWATRTGGLGSLHAQADSCRPSSCLP